MLTQMLELHNNGLKAAIIKMLQEVIISFLPRKETEYIKVITQNSNSNIYK